MKKLIEATYFLHSAIGLNLIAWIILRLSISCSMKWCMQLKTQGLRSEFQMTGANHYLMTLIHLKTLRPSFSPIWCNLVFLKINGCNCAHCTSYNRCTKEGASKCSVNHCHLIFNQTWRNCE